MYPGGGNLSRAPKVWYTRYIETLKALELCIALDYV